MLKVLQNKPVYRDFESFQRKSPLISYKEESPKEEYPLYKPSDYESLSHIHKKSPSRDIHKENSAIHQIKKKNSKNQDEINEKGGFNEHFQNIYNSDKENSRNYQENLGNFNENSRNYEEEHENFNENSRDFNENSKRLKENSSNFNENYDENGGNYKENYNENSENFNENYDENHRNNEENGFENGENPNEMRKKVDFEVNPHNYEPNYTGEKRNLVGLMTSSSEFTSDRNTFNVFI